MSRFNQRTARPPARGPIVTETTPSGQTHEGAPGYARDEKSELFLLAVSSMAGEPTFYESADARTARMVALARTVAVADPAWILGFVRWLRAEGNMRSASIVIAAEAVKARLDEQKAVDSRKGSTSVWYTDATANREIIKAALLRADEPGEMLAYWVANHGRTIPKPVKRGVADAVSIMYTEYNLLKHDTASKGFRFGDVLDLTHPSAVDAHQGHLYQHALDRRHGRDNLARIAEYLPMVYANIRLRSYALEGHPERLLDTERLKAAGMTWEAALALAGDKVNKAALWEALIPTMGYMALLRNLRNFDQAGISDTVAAKVISRLINPVEVAKSRQFPFRFLAAYRAAPSLRWGHALDVALTHSLANVPVLPGRTLVLVDRSGSMFGTMSGKSELTRADAAAVFGAALALRNLGRADLVEFGSTSRPVPMLPGGSLLKTVERFHDLGGTYTTTAVRAHYAGHDRVVIVTDEQACDGDPGSAIPPTVPLYTWNLAGYRHGHGPGSHGRYTFGGLVDSSFGTIPLLEARQDGRWPWGD